MKLPIVFYALLEVAKAEVQVDEVVLQRWEARARRCNLRSREVGNVREKQSISNTHIVSFSGPPGMILQKHQVRRWAHSRSSCGGKGERRLGNCRALRSKHKVEGIGKMRKSP